MKVSGHDDAAKPKLAPGEADNTAMSSSAKAGAHLKTCHKHFSFASAGSCEKIGKRPTMEDAICSIPCLCPETVSLGELRVNASLEFKPVPGDANKVIGVFGVFDGHGGRSSAEFCGKVVPYALLTKPNRYTDMPKALSEAFATCDNLLRDHLQCQFADSTEFSSGCTAVTACVTLDRTTKSVSIDCANVGDSRCVIVTRDGKAVAMSEDHVPTLERERERIERSGGFISSPKFGSCQPRVLGALAVTRALGDFDFKMPRVSSWGTNANPIEADLVTAEPEIRSHQCNEDDMALVLACDGIWNVFTSDEVAEFVCSKLRKLDKVLSKAPDAQKCELVATALVDTAIQRGSQDNCSCIVIILVPVRDKGTSSLCAIS